MPLGPRPEIGHVLFDFDGTLSLIRQGWPEVMVPMFVEVMPALAGRDRGRPSRGWSLDDIMRLNGKQTIYQMIQLADRVSERGGEPREPLWYKHEYLRRLEDHIGARTAGLRDGAIRPDDLLVHGVRRPARTPAGARPPALPGQRHRRIRRQAGGRAARRRPATSARTSTARRTITRTSRRRWSSTGSSPRTASTGRRLLSFGDGYVEIENTKEVGGLAVAVASDEANNGSGRVDEWKRERLLGRRGRRRDPRLSRRRPARRLPARPLIATGRLRWTSEPLDLTG